MPCKAVGRIIEFIYIKNLELRFAKVRALSVDCHCGYCFAAVVFVVS